MGGMTGVARPCTKGGEKAHLQKAHVHIDDLIIQPTRTGHTLNILPPDVDAGVDVLYQDLRVALRTLVAE